MTTVKQFCVFSVAALAAASIGTRNVQAGLIGHTVNSTYYYPDRSSAFENDGTQTISPTASFTASGGLLGELVTDSQIFLSNPTDFSTFFNPGSFNGPVFDFIGSGSLIQSVALDGASNVAPTSFDLVSDGAGGQLIEINFADQQLFLPGFNVTLDVTTTSVPEPGSLTVLGVVFASLGILGWTNKRRVKSTVS